MPRVKRGVTSLKRRRSVLKKAKGYIFGRSRKEREAKQAVTRAGQHSYAHRRTKKRDFRRLWNIRIGAGLAAAGLSYSQFINKLKEKNILLNRKVLSDLAKDNPETFDRIIEQAK